MENQTTTEEVVKKRQIRKIGINVGGLKGLSLSGTIESVEKNKPIINSFLDGIKHPIHRALEDKIADLRAHVLEICGLVISETPKSRVFELREGCEILAIEFELGEDAFFKIKASSRVFDKFQTITTPKIDTHDGYEWFDDVMDILKDILTEVDHYVNKTKIISNEELMISYIKHGKGVGVNMDEYEAMDRDAKAEFLQKKLTELGFLANVMDTEEMNEEEVEETTEEVEEPVEGIFGSGNDGGVKEELDFEAPTFESKAKSKSK